MLMEQSVDMSAYIGKSFKRKNGLDGVAYTVTQIDENFVICDNGKIKKSTFLEEFELVDNAASATVIPQQPKTPNELLLEQLEKLQELSNQSAAEQEKEMEKQGYMTPPNFGDDEPNTPTNQTSNQPMQPKPPKRPEYDAFDRVLKTENVLLNIPVQVSLPKADKMSIMNELYNISFTAYLAKQIIEDSINGSSETLKRTIQTEIERWMTEQLEGPSNRKPAKKPAKRIVKKEIVQEEPIVEDDDFVPPAMRQQRTQNWDGNTKTLKFIENDEQYDAVAKIVKGFNGSPTPEIYRLEGMMEIYEMGKK